MSSLYYLRARYMNPSTGTFLTVDTYEGSIYEPATLHKYLYANGNPVTYSDPGGHFAGIIGCMVSITARTIAENYQTLHTLGMISGMMNSVITAFLGGSGVETGEAFIKGYLTGFGVGAVMYVAAAFEIMTIAEFLMIGAASNTIMNIVLMTAAVISGDSKSALVYGTLSVLSFIAFCQAYNMNGSVTVTGNKGTARIEIEGAGDAAVSEGGAYSEAPMSGDDWHRYFNETYGSNNVTWESASPDDIIDMPSKITDFSPNQIVELASKNGWSAEPLGKGSLAGIPYEQGGGMSMHAPNGSSLYIQYHPGRGHHGEMPYYKVSSGKNGIVRYYLNGERAQ